MPTVTYRTADMTPDERAEAFAALDDIRAVGAVNMLGAAPVLADVMGYDKRTAVDVLVDWMATYDGARTPADRAGVA